MICDLLAITLVALAKYRYCEPVAVVSLSHTSGQNLYWRCDCTKARGNIKFVIQEAIWDSIPIKTTDRQ